MATQFETIVAVFAGTAFFLLFLAGVGTTLNFIHTNPDAREHETG